MNKTIYLIVGLPGSGIDQHLAQYGAVGAETKYAPTSYERELPPLLRSGSELVAIADYNLCTPQNRKQIVDVIHDNLPYADIKFTYFANDPFQCILNLQPEMGERAPELVWRFSRQYVIPNNIEVVKVSALECSDNLTEVSYEPSTTSRVVFRLVREADHLVCLVSADWADFQRNAWFILQYYPKFKYRIMKEQYVRVLKEVSLDDLVV